MDTIIDIKALRDRLGWDQGQMAEYLGLDRSSVSRMENGQEPKGPSLKLLQQLAETVPADEATNKPVEASAAA